MRCIRAPRRADTGARYLQCAHASFQASAGLSAASERSRGGRVSTGTRPGCGAAVTLLVMMFSTWLLPTRGGWNCRVLRA
jgi:hypothetical protein